jgi:hypothetical protein
VRDVRDRQRAVGVVVCSVCFLPLAVLFSRIKYVQRKMIRQNQAATWHDVPSGGDECGRVHLLVFAMTAATAAVPLSSVVSS